MQGDVVSNIFKGVHYELEVKANGYDWIGTHHQICRGRQSCGYQGDSI